jgi:hypothetical protein
LIKPFVFDAGWSATLSGIGCGLAQILLCHRRGPMRNRYGASDWLVR